VNRQIGTDVQLEAGRNPLCQWFLSRCDSWKEMNTPQNHHGNCHYPALAASALRSGTGKAKARPPSQVEAEAEWQGHWEHLNGWRHAVASLVFKCKRL